MLGKPRRRGLASQPSWDEPRHLGGDTHHTSGPVVAEQYYSEMQAATAPSKSSADDLTFKNIDTNRFTTL